MYSSLYVFIALLAGKFWDSKPTRLKVAKVEKLVQTVLSLSAPQKEWEKTRLEISNSEANEANAALQV